MVRRLDQFDFEAKKEERATALTRICSIARARGINLALEMPGVLVSYMKDDNHAYLNDVRRAHKATVSRIAEEYARVIYLENNDGAIHEIAVEAGKSPKITKIRGQRFPIPGLIGNKPKDGIMNYVNKLMY